MAMIEVSHVSMDYILFNDRILSIKEYLIKQAKGELHKKYFHALQDISFSVEKGEVFGIIGNNGAGKSTLLKIVSGILKPTKGSVIVHGSIAPMLELGSGLDYDLSGRENIFLSGSILGFSEDFLKKKYDEIVDFAELGEFIDVPIRNYSSGMVMRLAFSIASMVIPDVLILDEIMSVGDAGFQEKSKARMMELINGGTTVLFVSHSIEQVQTLCSRVLWIDHGQEMAVGAAANICDQYQFGDKSIMD